MRSLYELGALFIGVAALALLVGHPQGTQTLASSVSSGFGNLLATVELAGGYAGNSGITSPYSFGASPIG